MEQKYIAMVVVIIIVILFVAGTLFGEQQIDISGCTAKWSTVDKTVGQSELCPSESCTATPAAQQNNAIADAMLCACEKAKSSQYVNSTATKRIEEVAKEFFGYTITAQQICEQPGAFLTKRSYG